MTRELMETIFTVLSVFGVTFIFGGFLTIVGLKIMESKWK